MAHQGRGVQRRKQVMAGLSKAIDAFNRILWADAEIVGVNIDYGDLSLTIRESMGTQKKVICAGYVGYELVGFWDEVVIVRAELSPRGVFLDRCMSSIAQRLGTDLPPSGSEARNCDQVMQLVVSLHDGCQLNVAMKDLRVVDRI